MALAPGGIWARQSAGGKLLIDAWLTDADGADIVYGSFLVWMVERLSGGTLKTYDWNDNTFKSTTVTTRLQALTHRTGNNAAQNTGIWTYVLSTVSGFTLGGIYYLKVEQVSAPTGPGWPQANGTQKFQWGGSDGDLSLDSSGRVTVASIVNGAIAAATFAANALDAVWSTTART